MKQFSPVIMAIVASVVVLTLAGPSYQSCGHNFEQAFVNKHNEYRSQHGAGPLQLSSEISNWAQQWADYLASTGKSLSLLLPFLTFFSFQL